jgi:pentatricopeptide repeat protein
VEGVVAGMQVETTRGSAAAAFEAKGSAHLDKLSDWSNSDLSEAERAGKARKVALLTGGGKPSADSDVSDDFEAAVASTAARRRKKADAAARAAALAAGVPYVEPSAQAAAAPAQPEAPAAAAASAAPAASHASDAHATAPTAAAASELAHPLSAGVPEASSFAASTPPATGAAASEPAAPRSRVVQSDAAPTTAAGAVPATWLQQAAVAAAAGSDGGASIALVEEAITLTPGGDGSNPSAPAPAFLRPAAPQRPALPAALAHAAVDDAGNVLLERVADAPLGDGLTESPFPGLVRRRRSGVPLAPTEYMARPANLAPSIATELEGAAGGDEASEEAGELLAGTATGTGAGVGATPAATQAAAAAVGASASPAPLRQRSALEVAADDADTVLAAVRAGRSAATGAGSGALAALQAGAAQGVAPLSPEQRMAQQRERERQDIIAAARLEVAQLLMPAPAVPSAELYPHLASKHLRKRSRAYNPGDAAADAAGEAGNPQQLRRRIVARAVARMLRQEMLPRLERSLVLASEDVRKYRKRRALGLAPSAMDAMMAVQVLKDRAQEAAQGKTDATDAAAASASRPAGGFEPSAPAPAPGDALATLPAPGESALAAAEPGVSRGQRTHAARQDAALQVAGALTASGSRGELRMRALVDMSERVLAGAHWLPMGGRSTAGAYPTDRAALKAVLLTELENVYHGELPRMGVSPDIVTLNTVLNAYCVAGANEQAYNFLKVEFPRWGFSPDARTFRSLVSMHVHQRRTEKAEKVLQLMKAHGVAPDQDTYGLLVHARARDYRIKDAIALLQEMQAAGHVCGEYYAFLLRQRCKELGIFHAAVPAHPVGWQFTPEVMAKRRSGSQMAHKLSKFMRPKIGKFR